MIDCRALVKGMAYAGLGLVLASAVRAAGEGVANPAAPVQPVQAGPQAASPPVPAGASTRRSLEDAVHELETEHGVTVMDPWGAIEGADSGPADLRGRTPEAAFGALLENFELLFYYPPAGAPGARHLTEVWIYPPGMLDRQFLGSQAGQGAALMAGDAASRRAAMVESVIMRDPAAAESVVLRGLQDSSGEVRARTLAAATGMGIPIPRETLFQMMQSDPAEEARAAAFDALAADAGTDVDALRELVRRAELDPSPVLQSKAVELAHVYLGPADVPDVAPVPEVVDVPTEPPGGVAKPEGTFSAPLR
ncbi:MAG TPA: HEAT repeat domain-containing protein [Burkholderiales bacterium]